MTCVKDKPFLFEEMRQIVSSSAVVKRREQEQDLNRLDFWLGKSFAFGAPRVENGKFWYIRRFISLLGSAGRTKRVSPIV